MLKTQYRKTLIGTRHVRFLEVKATFAQTIDASGFTVELTPFGISAFTTDLSIHDCIVAVVELFARFELRSRHGLNLLSLLSRLAFLVRLATRRVPRRTYSDDNLWGELCWPKIC